MCYSIEPRDRRYVEGYGFLFFAKNMGKNIGKNLSDKYSQKVASKRTIQKTAEATGDLIGDKIANKITKASKLHSKESINEIPKERYISPEERQQIIDELRLI